MTETNEEMILNDIINELEYMKQNIAYMSLSQLETFKEHRKRYRIISKIINERAHGKRNDKLLIGDCR